MKAARIPCWLLLAGLFLPAPICASGAVILSAISDQAIVEDSSTGPIAFSITGFLSRTPTVTARSDNATLIPEAGMVITGAGGSRTLAVTPAPDQSGSATLTVTVNDIGGTDTETFRLTVRPVNDPPSIGDIPDQNLDAGTSTGPISFTLDDVDTPAEKLVLSAVSTDTKLVPEANIVFGGTGNKRTVTISPSPGLSGDVTLRVSVSDGSLSASDSFLVRVSSPVLPPRILVGPQSATVQEGGTVTFRVTATGAEPLEYQWQLNGQDLRNGTESAYEIRNVESGQAGEYTVRIRNRAGAVVSSPAVLTVVRLDFGDTPDGSLAPGYPTLLANDGARHVILSGFSLGATVDSEPEARVSADATGDDTGGAVPDDEDGVEFLTVPLVAGQTAQARITLPTRAGNGGRVDAFIDFNGDGAWSVPAERILSAHPVLPGPNTVTFTVPADTKPGSTFARFRLSREGKLGPTGLAADGEVEDYAVRITSAPSAGLDFGDAPESSLAVLYRTRLASNGPRHRIVPGFFLGRRVDAEPDGQPNADATGDDMEPKDLDDEDGVWFSSPLEPGMPATLIVTSSTQGVLDAWFDFNRAGGFEAGERAITRFGLVPGPNTIVVDVPVNAVPGTTFARFRLSREGVETPDHIGSTAPVPEGEVEDYEVRIESGPPCDANYKGTQFWLTFPGNYPAGPDTPLRLTLCIVGPEGITGTVTAPGLRYSRDFTLPASMVVEVVLPDVASLGDAVDVVGSKGIHVEAKEPVAVYGLNRIPYSSDGYLGLPTGVLGTEYIVSGYRNEFSGVSALNGTQFAVVATEDETLVTVIPSRALLGHAKGEPFTVPMKRGQTYQLRDPNDATADLTGTEILADKPVAVFAGHQCANIDSPSKMFCDHLVEQLLPVAAWSKVFHAVPLATRSNGDVLRVVGSRNNTQLFLNAADAGFVDRGQVRTFNLGSVTRVEADHPVLVTQFARSSDHDGVENADPFMVLVPPVRFYTRDHMICTGPSTLVTHRVNIVAPSSVAGSLTLNGVAVPAAAFTPIGASGFSSARITVPAGVHALSASQPFGTIVYGFGPYEGYGWPGGMFFGDITPPSITCPPDFTVSTGVVGGTTSALKCVALVPDLRDKVTVSDNCRLPTQRVLTQSPEPGTPLGPGRYVITLVARDASGNEAECQVTMTVVDPGPASIVCPQDVTVLCNKGAGASVAYQVIARTECGTLVPVECSPASGALFLPGVTTVHCRVKDAPDVTCTFKVTVVCPESDRNGIPLRSPPKLSWTGEALLETSFSLKGPWTLVPEANSPFSPAAVGPRQFFRLRAASSVLGLQSRVQAPILKLE